jgi:hypothetical protein
MYLNEDLISKWSKVLEHPACTPIRDQYRKGVIAQLLENQEKDCREQGTLGATFLAEAPHANSAGSAGGTFPDNPNLRGYDPVLISLLRRALPNLMAFDLAGVQPLDGPTGLIFTMRSKYTSQAGTEALHNEADTTHSGTGTHTDPLDPTAGTGEPQSGRGLDTWDGEKLGTGGAEPEWPEMALSIERISVIAKTRALKAEYTMELAQDLKAIHGLDAEAELANILSAEIMAEINREVIRTIYQIAEPGASYGTTNPGEFDLDLDADGRWSVEKYKGLMYQLEREANAIAKRTRRGRGNIIVCDSDTASALSMTGLLDNAPALKDSLSVDDTGNTFVGVLNGRFKVYIDPYAPLGTNYAVVGYRGSNAFDAGLFYCPYVPLQLVRALGENSFQPKIGFKTRYGLVTNPFAKLSGDGDGSLAADENTYYRKVKLLNIL